MTVWADEQQREQSATSSEDVDNGPYFPNAYTVTKRPNIPADFHVDLYYRDLSQIESNSYEVVL